MKQSIKSYREQATGESNITGWLDQAIIANIVSTALGNVTSQYLVKGGPYNGY